MVDAIEKMEGGDTPLPPDSELVTRLPTIIKPARDPSLQESRSSAVETSGGADERTIPTTPATGPAASARPVTRDYIG